MFSVLSTNICIGCIYTMHISRVSRISQTLGRDRACHWRFVSRIYIFARDAYAFRARTVDLCQCLAGGRWPNGKRRMSLRFCSLNSFRRVIVEPSQLFDCSVRVSYLVFRRTARGYRHEFVWTKGRRVIFDAIFSLLSLSHSLSPPISFSLSCSVTQLHFAYFEFARAPFLSSVQLVPRAVPKRHLIYGDKYIQKTVPKK